MKDRINDLLKQADEMATMISVMQRMYDVMQQLVDMTHRMVGETHDMQPRSPNEIAGITLPISTISGGQSVITSTGSRTASIFPSAGR